MLADILIKYNLLEMAAFDVYSDIFFLGENRIQKENECAGQFKANPIGYYTNKNQDKGHFRVLFDDTFKETLKELQNADFAILNGLSYFGRRNLQEHASKMYAMIFDIDGVTERTLNNFLYSCTESSTIYPMPNYIILSGHGVHLYYLFEEPINLYPNIKVQLKEFKYALTQRMWNRYTSETWDKVQYQGINQGFRVIGGKTKIDGLCVRAFKTNQKKWTIRELNEFVPDNKVVDEQKLFKESKMTIEQAKEKYPEWYQRKVLNKEKKGTWVCKQDLYNWWLREIQIGATVGHRYFCIMTLAIYAVKSGVDKEKLTRDALSLLDSFNNMDSNNPFTENDILSALECFDDRYITFPKNDISRLSGIQIKTNKRNGRTQLKHLEGARAIRDINNDNWRVGNGRPTKQFIITEWRQNNPKKRKVECIKETGLDKKTVYKWWDNMDLDLYDGYIYNTLKKDNFFKLTSEEQIIVAQNAILRAQNIAEEKNITEEEAFNYLVYRNQVAKTAVEMFLEDVGALK